MPRRWSNSEQQRRGQGRRSGTPRNDQWRFMAQALERQERRRTGSLWPQTLDELSSAGGPSTRGPEGASAP
jgi:hypothetical protein